LVLVEHRAQSVRSGLSIFASSAARPFSSSPRAGPARQIVQARPDRRQTAVLRIDPSKLRGRFEPVERQIRFACERGGASAVVEIVRMLGVELERRLEAATDFA